MIQSVSKKRRRRIRPLVARRNANRVGRRYPILVSTRRRRFECASGRDDKSATPDYNEKYPPASIIKQVNRPVA
jgi:hypothetical protein